MSGPFSSDYPTVRAGISIDGEYLPSVGIRKKGFIGSQSIEKPSLKINLDEYMNGVDIACTDNVTLNNGVQGPSVIRQCLAYSLFKKAGLVAPNCNFANVSLNGEPLGVYAHVEPIKRSFLRNQFGSDDGDLYEGTLSDFSDDRFQMFDPKTDETDPTFQAILDLVDLLEGEDNSTLEAELSDHIHLKDFLRYWAMEVLTGHWDGFNGNTNNFYIYRDSESKKFTFIPWGLDDTFDPDASNESQLYSKTLLSNRVMGSTVLKEMLDNEISDLLNTVWNEDEIEDELHSMGELLHGEMSDEVFLTEVNEARLFISERRAHILSILSEPAEELSEPYCLIENGYLNAEFDTTWGSNTDDDLTTVGSLNMEMMLDGSDISFASSGVGAGPLESETLDRPYDNLIMVGVADPISQALLVPYLYYPSELVTTESPLELGLQGVVGSLYYSDNTLNGQFYEIAHLHDGSITFDSYNRSNGGQVKGEINTLTYSWELAQ